MSGGEEAQGGAGGPPVTRGEVVLVEQAVIGIVYR